MSNVLLAGAGEGLIPNGKALVRQSSPGRPSTASVKDWRVAKRLGEGGLGESWLARHEKTGDRQVFKFCYDAASLRCLQREITLFRLLKEELGDRDDISRIVDWSFDEAPYFVESKYTMGGSLADWAEEQGGLAQVPLAVRLEIVAQVATALAAAHSVGVLHKDVKPSNVLIDERISGEVRARLSDFGVGAVTEAKRLAEAGITVLGLTERTEDGSSSYSGTRLYAAPEVSGDQSAATRRRASLHRHQPQQPGAALPGPRSSRESRGPHSRSPGDLPQGPAIGPEIALAHRQC